MNGSIECDGEVKDFVSSLPPSLPPETRLSECRGVLASRIFRKAARRTEREAEGRRDAFGPEDDARSVLGKRLVHCSHSHVRSQRKRDFSLAPLKLVAFSKCRKSSMGSAKNQIRWGGGEGANERLPRLFFFFSSIYRYLLIKEYGSLGTRVGEIHTLWYKFC